MSLRTPRTGQAAGRPSRGASGVPGAADGACRDFDGLVGALVDQGTVGLICLDSAGRILETNVRAREVLREFGSGVPANARFPERPRHSARSRAPRCRLSDCLADHAAAIERLVEDALGQTGAKGTGAAMVLGEWPDRRSLVLHCRPVVDPSGSGTAAAVVVVIVDPWMPPAVDPDLLRRTLGLTPAESRVAAALAEGMTVRRIARATGIRRNSVRWLLKQCFAKTNCRRQADLVRLVLSVSRLPMPAAGPKARE